MYSKKLFVGAIALLFLPISARSSVTYTFTSPAFEIGKQSNGSLLNTTFTFQLGVFASGFNPTALNESIWQSNFSPIGVGNAWVDEGDGTGEISGLANLTGNTTPFLGGSVTQLYIWGFNSLSIAPTSQWILLTNTAANWKVLTDPGTAGTAFLDTSDAGTSAIVGALGTPFVSANPYIQTAAVIVPEASSIVLLGGACFGLMSMRRRSSLMR